MTERDGDSVDTWCRKTPSQTVIEAVAEAEDVSPAELRPPTYESLHTVIDPEALDALFAQRGDGTPRPGGEVSFQFCEYEVTIEPDGSVSVSRSAD